MIDLAERGISLEQAAEMRARLRTIAEDWDRPEMEVYDTSGPDEKDSGLAAEEVLGG